MHAQAYLQVHSPLGMIVDDCPVMPSSSGTPATVPLSNNSRFSIAHKVFVFTYPPKDIRPALIASPRPSPEKTRRALRLSMIQTSQVFSPLRRAYAPEDQIIALKSPVKPFASHAHQEDDIVLIDGDVENAVVVEEEKDLIVLEEVDVVRAIEVCLVTSRPNTPALTLAIASIADTYFTSCTAVECVPHASSKPITRKLQPS